MTAGRDYLPEKASVSGEECNCSMRPYRVVTVFSQREKFACLGYGSELVREIEWRVLTPDSVRSCTVTL